MAMAYYECLSVLSLINQTLRDIFVFESEDLHYSSWLVHNSVVIQKELNAWNMQLKSYKDLRVD